MSEYRMYRPAEVEPPVMVFGVGTTSLDGLFYDRDPGEGGTPLMGLLLLVEVDGEERQTGMFGLGLVHAAALYVELVHRAEEMGFGPAFLALVDQHKAGLKEFNEAEPEAEATAVCARCGARPRRKPGSDRAEFDHTSDCSSRGQS